MKPNQMAEPKQQIPTFSNTANQRMLLKRGMGNGEWGMGNGEWEIENGKWEIENGKLIFFSIKFLKCGINSFSGYYRYPRVIFFTFFARIKGYGNGEVTLPCFLISLPKAIFVIARLVGPFSEKL